MRVTIQSNCFSVLKQKQMNTVLLKACAAPFSFVIVNNANNIDTNFSQVIRGFFNWRNIYFEISNPQILLSTVGTMVLRVRVCF